MCVCLASCSCVLFSYVPLLTLPLTRSLLPGLSSGASTSLVSVSLFVPAPSWVPCQIIAVCHYVVLWLLVSCCLLSGFLKSVLILLPAFVSSPLYQTMPLWQCIWSFSVSCFISQSAFVLLCPLLSGPVFTSAVSVSIHIVTLSLCSVSDPSFHATTCPMSLVMHLMLKLIF